MLERIVMFLVGAVVDFFSFVLIARFLMQALRVSFANPVGQTILALSSWAVVPSRRIMPGIFGLDMASLVPAWLLQAALVAFGLVLRGGDAVFGAIGAVLPAALALGAVDVVRIAVYVAIVALIAAAVASWVNPRSPMAQPAMQLTRPLLRPIQRFVPPLANVDLSPLIAILLLQVLLMLLDGLKASVLSVFLS